MAAPVSFQIGAEIIRQFAATLPALPGVYRMLNAKEDVLYIGKAKNLPKRVQSYTQITRLPRRLQQMVSQTTQMMFTVTQSEAEALLLEASLIKEHWPKFNVLLKDDSSYPLLKFSGDHEFPALSKYRGSRLQPHDYFGPFASGSALYAMIEVLQKGFMLRNCSDAYFAARTRPCLQYHIKRCTAPCVNKVEPAAYSEQVRQAKAYLKGGSSDVQAQLAAQMQVAAENKDYEQAAMWRDRLKALSSNFRRQLVHLPNMNDADCWGLHQAGDQLCLQLFIYRGGTSLGNKPFFLNLEIEQDRMEVLPSFLMQFYVDHALPPQLYLDPLLAPVQTLLQDAFSQQAGFKVKVDVPQRGEKFELIMQVQRNAAEALARELATREKQSAMLTRMVECFGLAKPPNRIEIFDNSHLQGTHPYGVMVVACADGLNRKEYRKYAMKDLPDSRDDYAMMRDMLTRRAERIAQADETVVKPDLWLIDGGKGQLGVAQAVVDEYQLDITVVGIAKGPERNAGREEFYMRDRPVFMLPAQDPLLYYLQRLRDEAHRFAITTHRAGREKAIRDTGLDAVPGIGAKRKKALMMHFGSAKAVREAGVKDLMMVDGISEKMAKGLVDYFKN